MSKNIEDFLFNEDNEEQKEIDECCNPKFNASAGATGQANSKYCNVKVTASSSATAEGNTLEEAYSSAFNIAQNVANSDAQFSANIIDQTIDIILSCPDIPLGKMGPTGPTGPTGPEGNINVIGSGTGNILLKNTNGVYYSDVLNVSNNAIEISDNLIPTQANVYSLGSQEFPWKEIYMGPGSLNIAGPTGSIQDATLGSNLSGIAYSQFGFATPFMNIGPKIDPSAPIGTIGGWQIYGTGPSGSNFTDLVAQLIDDSGAGLTGPVF
jgi:hypothetical protein